MEPAERILSGPGENEACTHARCQHVPKISSRATDVVARRIACDAWVMDEDAPKSPRPCMHDECVAIDCTSARVRLLLLR